MSLLIIMPTSRAASFFIPILCFNLIVKPPHIHLLGKTSSHCQYKNSSAAGYFTVRARVCYVAWSRGGISCHLCQPQAVISHSKALAHYWSLCLESSLPYLCLRLSPHPSRLKSHHILHQKSLLRLPRQTNAFPLDLAPSSLMALISCLSFIHSPHYSRRYLRWS